MFQSSGGKWVLVVEYMQPLTGLDGVSPEEMVNEINRQMQDACSVLRRQTQTSTALSHSAHRYYYRTMPRAMHARMSTAFRSWSTQAFAARQRVGGGGGGRCAGGFSSDAMDFLQMTLQQQSSDQLRIAVETRLLTQQAILRLDCLVANSPLRSAPMWAKGDIVDHTRRSQHSTPLAQVVRRDVPDDGAHEQGGRRVHELDHELCGGGAIAMAKASDVDSAPWEFAWEGRGRGGGDGVGEEGGKRKKDEVRLAVPNIEFSSRRKTRTLPEEEPDLSSGDESRESNQEASDTSPLPRLSLSLNLSNITETNLESREPTPVSKGGEKGGQKGGVGSVAAAEDGEEEEGEDAEEEEDALLPQTVFSRHAF